MKWIMTGMIAAAVLLSFFTGRTEEVSEAFISECGGAVELMISLTGIIVLWSGVMRAAQKAGITEMLAKMFSPLLSRLFGGLKKDGKAMQYITLNITANLLGLGNASTPFGIAAMREIENEEAQSDKTRASHNMILLTVLNTASIQLIPTTAIALRLKNGSAAPAEIIPCVWVSSLLSVTAAVTAATVLRRICGRRLV